MASRTLEIIIEAKNNAEAKIKDIGPSIEKGLKKASIAAGVAGVALGAFVYKTATGFADLGEQLDLFTKKSGVGAEAASAMKYSLESMNLSMDVAEIGVKKMQDTLVSMGGNAKLAAANLGPLHLKLQDLKGLAPEEQMFKLGNAIAQIQDPAARTAAAINIFGKAGTDLIPMFGEGKVSLTEFINEAKKMGVVMNQDALNSALALDDQLDKLKGTMGGLATQIGAALAPTITKLIDEQIRPALVAVAEWIQKNPELTLKIVEWTGAILGATFVLGPLITAVTTLGTALAFVAANPVVLIIAACFALGVAIGLLINNWDAVKAKVIEVWGTIEAWVGEKVGAIKVWLEDLIAGGILLVQGAWEALLASVDAVMNKISNVVSTKIGEVKSWLSSLMDSLKSALDKLAEFSGFNSYTNAVKNAGVATGVALGLRSAPASKKAMGGRTDGLTLVGEQGPELVRLDAHGMVTPNSGLGGGTTINVIVKGNTLLSDAPEVAMKIGDMIIGRLRLNTRLT